VPVPSRPPGRPREVDVAAVARIAVDLFTERGYDRITLDDVAAAAGISRRSLFNHFPAKVDLLWSGFEQYTDRLHERLSRPAPGERGLADVVVGAMLGALDDLGDDGLALARARLRVVAAHPDTAAAGQRVVTATRSVLLSFLRTHLEDDLASRCVAGGLAAAVYEAMVWWAVGDAASPAEPVTIGLRALLDGHLGRR